MELGRRHVMSLAPTATRMNKFVSLILFAMLWLSPHASAKSSSLEVPTHAEWLTAMQQAQTLNLSGKVMRARTLFNDIAWSADQGTGGHWATPAELLEKGSGDLLDLVTAYYFTLRGMGVPADDIRLYFGQIRTLDRPVPHLLLAVRAADRSVYFIDPIKDLPMSDEPPTEFRPTLALNETGTWWTPALTDLSVWNSLSTNLIKVAGWTDVCDSSLAFMGLMPLSPPTQTTPAPDPFLAAIESDPPAAGIKKKKPRNKKKRKVR